MFFNKSYELPLAKNYVQHWGMAEAVRELIQNALDSESPFEYAFSGDSLRIRSRFALLSPSTLLLGATSKADSPDTIGSFGEGYKIALLVLTRAGYPVKIFNGGRIWTPAFRESRQFGAEVLCIDDSASPSKNEGVCFEVSGLSPDDIAQIRTTCLHMQSDIGEVIDVEQGQIMLGRPGKLYVGGLFVCDTQMEYGYNVKPEYLTLERDRQTVSGFDLKWLAKEMWFRTERWDEVGKLIEDDTTDLEYADHGTPKLAKEACYRAFIEKHPGAVVAKSQDELDKLVKQGMTNVVVVHQRTYASIVTSHASYSSNVVIQQTPEQVLKAWFSANRSNMHRTSIVAFKELIEQAADWRFK